MTAFDAAIAAIQIARYHNHRLEDHSDTVSNVIFADLIARCAPLREDYDRQVVRFWLNVGSPGDRLRKVDLFVGEPDPDGLPDISKVRIALENKSVITAHRNRTSRFDDLSKVLGAIHAVRPETIMLGTVLIGMARRVLNVPDQVHPFYKKSDDKDKEREFQEEIVPRLSSGDQTLWKDFAHAVSKNTSEDPTKTLALLKTIPTRKPGHTHVKGYDFLLWAPVFIDNVNPPSLPRPNTLGIDVDAEYERMLEQVCSAYTARWHM